MWETCLNLKKKNKGKEEEEGPTPCAWPGGAPHPGYRPGQECGLFPGCSSPGPAPRKGCSNAKAFYSELAK